MIRPLRDVLSTDDWLVTRIVWPSLVAACPVTGAQLKVSAGRRRTGRPARYYLTFPPQPPTQPVTGTKWLSIADHDVYRRFTAYSDAEAIQTANQKIALRTRDAQTAPASDGD